MENVEKVDNGAMKVSMLNMAINIPAKGSLAAVEKMIMLRVVAGCNNNVDRAARELGISKQTLYRRLEKWRLELRERVLEALAKAPQREIADSLRAVIGDPAKDIPYDALERILERLESNGN